MLKTALNAKVINIQLSTIRRAKPFDVAKSTYLSRICYNNISKLRLSELDQIVNNFGLIYSHLRQEFIFQLIHLLQQFFVYLPVLCLIYYANFRHENRTNRLMIAHFIVHMASVHALMYALASPQNSVGPSRRPRFLASVKYVAVQVVLVGRLKRYVSFRVILRKVGGLFNCSEEVHSLPVTHDLCLSAGLIDRR